MKRAHRSARPRRRRRLAAAATAGRRTGEPINLTFPSLAFQEADGRRDRGRSSRPGTRPTPTSRSRCCQGSWDNVQRRARHPVRRRHGTGHHPRRVGRASSGSPSRATSPTCRPTSARTSIGSVSEGDLGQRHDTRRGDHRRADAAAVLRRVRQHRRCSRPPASRCRAARRWRGTTSSRSPQT